MLTRADNRLLTSTGPGTPMGTLFRRFWLPALLPSELPDPDGPPRRIRLLGEDLVAYRDSSGAIGLLAEACPHRGASMFFGRNEDAGLRCVYHGWKFDATGACIDMPNEPAESNFKHKVRATAYPTAEWGGLVWVYMGPPHLRPALPHLPWALLPAGHRHATKWVNECNYLQGMEGEIDTSHVGFLHRFLDSASVPGHIGTGEAGRWRADVAPQLTLQETDYGFVYGSRRNPLEGVYYWRVTQWLAPSFSVIPNHEWPRWSRAYVPIDDERCWVFNTYFHAERPLNAKELAFIQSGVGIVPRLQPGTTQPVATLANDFLIDREVQRTRTFTGIFGTNEQDIGIQQSMGPIIDRTKEHLGTADLAIIAARRILLRMARDLERGIEPYAAAHPEAFHQRSLQTTGAEPEFAPLLAAHPGVWLA